MRVHLRRFVGFCAILFLTNCASIQFASIKNVDKPLSFVRFSVLKAFPSGEESAENSGRKFLSRPFLYKSGEFVSASNSKFRYRAEVEIRGSDRPYSIEVRVYSEKRRDGLFVKEKYYRSLAQKLSKSIAIQLSKSLDELNIIDALKAL